MTSHTGSQPPLVAITLGDPAGIGPEVVVKALERMAGSRDASGSNGAAAHRETPFRPLVFGSLGVAESAAARFAPSLRFSSVRDAGALAGLTGVATENGPIPVWNVDVPGTEEIPFGEATAAGGAVSVISIEQAATLALAGAVNAISTAPINKEAVHLAGYQEIGHQEVLARMAGVTEIATMLMAGRLRAVHLTTHVPFKDAHTYVTQERILARLRLTDRCFREWGAAAPRLAVAALNPHGGDNGLLGREEIEEITPAVAAAKAEGIDVEGPLPADSVFLRAAAGGFDAVLALYHDQGHIAVKMHDFHGSVSVNLGLPFVRTSVDHGTAYDIAGRGIAEPVSMIAAIRTAAEMATGQGFAPQPAAAAQQGAAAV